MSVATSIELRQAIAASGATVQAEAGEFEGPWVLDGAVRLVGRGPATVLWAHSGPVLTIRAPNAHLEGLAIEVTDEPDGLALYLDGPALQYPPTLVGVRLLGGAAGFAANRRWRVPAVIDLGQIVPRGWIEHTIGVDVPGPVMVTPELAGLEVLVQPLSASQVVLQLRLDGSVLMAGTLLEGRIEVAGGGLSTLVRITGRIVAIANSVAATAAATSDPRDVVGLVTGAGRPERARPAPPPTSPGTATPGGAFNILAAAERQRQEGPSAAPPAPRPVPPAAVSASPTAPRAGSETPAEAAVVDRLLAEAAARVADGELERAQDLLRNAELLQPGAWRVQVALAQLHEKRGDFAAAMQAWERVQAGNPAYPDLIGSLARCYNQLERFDKSIELLESGLAQPANRSDPDLYRALASAYYRTGRRAEALWALDQALAIHPDPRLAALRRVWSQKAG